MLVVCEAVEDNGLSKPLEMVGEIGVIGLVGGLEGSFLSSLVRFFLRKPRLGI